MAMLVNPITPRVEYTATSGQTLFSVPFDFLDGSEDLEVYVEGVEVAFVSTGENSNDAKTVTIAAVTLGDTVVILRNSLIQRLTDFPASGPFDIIQLNYELDNIFLILQELEEFDSRVMALDPTVAEDEANWDAQGRR